MAANGFILARWMLSFALIGLLTSIASGLLVNWYQQIRTLHSACDRYIPLYLSLDTLASDIQQTDKKPVKQKNRLVLQYNEKSVRWTITKKRLMRRSSSYDTAKKKWTGSSSLMAEALSDCQIELLKYKKVNQSYGILMKLKTEGAAKLIERSVYIRKGMRL